MSVKSFLANIKLRQQKNRMDAPQLMFPGALQDPKHILVCLPDGLRELTLVKQILPDISEIFRPADIVLLSMPGIKVNDIFPRKGFQIMSPTSEHLSWSGLPKISFIERLKEMKFDLVLDLNLRQSIFTSCILLHFPSAVRIGRGNHRGIPYYNFEIKTKYLRDERNIYRSMLDTISTMRDISVR